MALPNTSAQPNDRPSKKLKILVADDEPVFLRALQRVLERRGHEVLTAPDAYSAVARLEAEPFDAVLVDHRMPGDGTRVLGHLEETDFEGVAILMTGGSAADAGSLAERVHRLEKPFPFRAVVPLLEQASAGA